MAVTEKKRNSKYKLIDDSVDILQDGTSEQKEEAAKVLLKVFKNLIFHTAKRIATKFPYEVDEIIPIVENKFIVMIMRYNSPRSDSRGKGKKIGAWAPNISVYLKKNLYFFSILEIKKDIEGFAKTGVPEDNVNVKSISDVDVLIDEKNSITELLDYVEFHCSPVARDLLTLKFIYRFRESEICRLLSIDASKLQTILQDVMLIVKEMKD